MSAKRTARISRRRGDRKGIGIDNGVVGSFGLFYEDCGLRRITRSTN